MEAPKPHLSIIPDSTEILTITKKIYTINTPCEISNYLKLLDIKEYQDITIKLPKGVYSWEDRYELKPNVNLTLIGLDWKNWGWQNKVSIFISKKIKCTDHHKFHSPLPTQSKLLINNNCHVTITGIDIIEKVDDSGELCPCSSLAGIFTLCGKNNVVFDLNQCKCEISSSPFINVSTRTIGNIFFGHTHFRKEPFASKDKILIVGTYNGWDFSGNKAYVSKSYTDTDNYCYFDTNNKKIEYLE